MCLAHRSLEICPEREEELVRVDLWEGVREKIFLLMRVTLPLNQHYPATQTGRGTL